MTLSHDNDYIAWKGQPAINLQLASQLVQHCSELTGRLSLEQLQAGGMRTSLEHYKEGAMLAGWIQAP